MDQINLIQAKGGQGTSVTACAVALRAAGEGRTVRLDGHDRDSLAAILGMTGDGAVIPGLVLGDNNGEAFDLVILDRRQPCRTTQSQSVPGRDRRLRSLRPGHLSGPGQ